MAINELFFPTATLKSIMPKLIKNVSFIYIIPPFKLCIVLLCTV